MTRSDRDWQRFALEDPYWAVLTDERFRTGALDDEARAAFFASGEAAVEELFALIRQHADPGFAPRSALDFGCGVGRLTRALAARVERAAGVDVAPAMLELARANVPSATFTSALPDGEFDFIGSLLVFQHIPVQRGLALLPQLLARLAPGGVAAIQFTFRRPGGLARRIAREVRARLPWRYMQMNEYPRDGVRAAFLDTGCAEPLFLPRMYGAIEGAIVLATKPA